MTQKWVMQVEGSQYSAVVCAAISVVVCRCCHLGLHFIGPLKTRGGFAPGVREEKEMNHLQGEMNKSLAN